MPDLSPLRFKVAPHILEDLGLNLYTSLPRVLVEFVANSYDADSAHADITLDKDAIDKERQRMKEDYEREMVSTQEGGGAVQPLASRTLSENLRIVVEDKGHGMSRDDLSAKFLIAGRRRRVEEPEAGGRSPGGRLLMGRKGIGKLAGFGVARLVEVVTRKEGESHATKITLDYNQLAAKRTLDDIVIPDERLEDGGGFGTSGTRVVLSRLFYDPMKSRPQTIEQDIAGHFALIDPGDFVIRLNGQPIDPAEPSHAYAWPQPDDAPIDVFVQDALPREGGGAITFQYRLRFTGENEALPAARRGIRVYARKRLTAMPSLLGADTNMHGFRMTDYLDGVLHADFLEEEEADYVATDRQSLRWESPLLCDLYDFLSDKIKEACKAYQKQRDKDAPNAVRDDEFTKQEISKYDFSKKDTRLTFRIAAALKSACKRGVKDPIYREKLPVLINGVSHGNILTAIAALAEEDHPDLGRVAVEIARLTKDELDQFMSAVKGRLKAIHALKKIVEGVEFGAPQNEKIIQHMFEKSPWMVDPTYTQFLTANQSMDTLFTRLARELQIGEHAPEDSENNPDRPDLVFLIANMILGRIVIVELKSANTALESKHLDQLELYMERAKRWLEQQGRTDIRIDGHLVGSMPDPNSIAKGAMLLCRKIRKSGPDTPWVVRDYLRLLANTEAAHDELLQVHRQAEAADAENAD